jgi:hypothetical protein
MQSMLRGLQGWFEMREVLGCEALSAGQRDAFAALTHAMQSDVLTLTERVPCGGRVCGATVILTASWFGPLSEDHVRIGISRGVPRRQPAGFRRYPKLNPGPWFASCATAEEYVARYDAEVLSRLDPRKVAEQLLELAGGRVPVLCCFERVGGPGWCHRALVAAWFEAAGIGCRELGHEADALHPLRPAPERKADRLARKLYAPSERERAVLRGERR